MRLHRFYVSKPVGSQSELILNDEDLANQLGRVFRLGKGDKIVVFDGSGQDYTCSIGSIASDIIALKVFESSRSRFAPALNGKKLVLFMALVKKDTFETVAEKATELGATEIVPILAERSEKKDINEERLRKIIKEASEQSGRGDVPLLRPIVPLKEALDSMAGSKAVVFHTEGEPYSKDDSNAEAIFIGPEGGWSPNEIVLFHENKIAVRCLGPQVLRAETAAVAALAKMVFAS